MSERINLKELFASDSQEVTIDKLNYNLNRLLELGIGERGKIGLTGGPGSIGPNGIQGIAGERGNKWFVGSGHPSLQTFIDLKDEDLYIDSTNSLFYQYDADTNAWSQTLDFGYIINNYLADQGSTFIRGFGTGSPSDTRFIIFPNRGNTINDVNNDKYKPGYATDNDILLLSNFNEKLGDINDPDNLVLQINSDLQITDEYFTALQCIYVNNTVFNSRNHLELGSLFVDNDGKYGFGTDANVLSKSYYNLKFRHEVNPVDVGGGGYVYRGLIGMGTMLPSESNTLIKDNSILDFVTTIYNPEEVPTPVGNMLQEIVPVGNMLHIKFGGAYGLYNDIDPDTYPESTIDLINGISIINVNGYANIGMMLNTPENPISNFISGEYFAIATSADGIVLNNTVYQDGGNIEQLGLNARELDASAISQVPVTYADYLVGYGAIFASGNTLFTVISEGTHGVYDDISNLNIGRGAFTMKALNNTTSDTLDDQLLIGATHIISSNTDIISGVAISDIDFIDDNYFILANNQFIDDAGDTYNSSFTDSRKYEVTYFQIGKYDTDFSSYPIKSIARIGLNENNVETITNANLLRGAWRCLVDGKYAVVATNHLRHPGAIDSGDWTADGNYARSGNIVTVSLNDLEHPSILGSYVNNNRVHHLDMVKFGDGVATLAIYFVPPISTSYYSGYVTRVDYYKINDNGTAIERYISDDLDDESYNITDSNFNDLSIINPWGAIESSGNYIYAVHSNHLFILKQNNDNDYPSTISSFNYINTTDYVKVLDCKLVGDYLYILSDIGSDTNTYRTSSYVVVHKVKVNDTTSLQTIFSQTVSGLDGAFRFEISGNNIYILGKSGTTSKIVPLEVDGIKSAHAKLGIVKSDYVDIMNDLTVGDRIKVGSSISVGEGGIFTSGGIVSQGLTILNSPNDIIIGSETRVQMENNYANIEVGTNAAGIYGNTLPIELITNNDVTLTGTAGIVKLQNNKANIEVTQSDCGIYGNNLPVNINSNVDITLTSGNDVIVSNRLKVNSVYTTATSRLSYNTVINPGLNTLIVTDTGSASKTRPMYTLDNDEEDLWVGDRTIDPLIIDYLDLREDAGDHFTSDIYVGEDRIIFRSTTDGSNIQLGPDIYCNTGDWIRIMKGTSGYYKIVKQDESLPIGTIQIYAGNTAPFGWAFCQGSPYDPSIYPGLASVIGKIYGGGATYKLPNLQGRVPVGGGSNQDRGYALGEMLGDKNAVVVDHYHKYNCTTYRTIETAKGTYGPMPNGNIEAYTTGAFAGAGMYAGQSGVDKNMQPYLVVNYIIKMI